MAGRSGLVPAHPGGLAMSTIIYILILVLIPVLICSGCEDHVARKHTPQDTVTCVWLLLIAVGALLTLL